MQSWFSGYFLILLLSFVPCVKVSSLFDMVTNVINICEYLYYWLFKAITSLSNFTLC